MLSAQQDQSPDEYFCEECRKDLHKVFTDKNGYVFSQLFKKFRFPRHLAPQPRMRERGADQSHKASDLKKHLQMNQLLHKLKKHR